MLLLQAFDTTFHFFDTRKLVKFKKEKEDLYIELEEQTFVYFLKYYDSEREKCKKLLDKKFSSSIFNKLMENMKEINFNIKNLDKIDITEEEKKIIMELQFSADKDVPDKDIYFREIYFGWIKREIDEERRKSDEENDKIKKLELKKILLKLKNISKIDEIEKLYDEFILIRRLGYV